MQVPLESFPKVMFPLKRSQEVLDFNLFISPFAIWEGVITHIEVKEVLPEGSILAQEGDRGLGSAREGYIEISDLA
jgi:S-adenosylmethionine hydrolase